MASTPTPEEPKPLTRAELEADVAKSAERVMKHMNDDHEDSLVAYVLAFATTVEGTDPEKDKEDALLKNIQKGMLPMTSAKLTGVDADGFVLEIQAQETPETVLTLKNVRVPYLEPISSAKDLHHTAVDMHRKAYDQLGVWYKTKTGYYNKAVKMATTHTYKSIQGCDYYKAMNEYYNSIPEYYKSIQESAKTTEKAPMVAGAAALVAATAAAVAIRSRSRA